MERVGEHDAAAWKFEKRTPRCAKASKWGVAISPPKAPKSLKPQSSATKITILGFGPFGALGERVATGVLKVAAKLMPALRHRK